MTTSGQSPTGQQGRPVRRPRRWPWVTLAAAVLAAAGVAAYALVVRILGGDIRSP